MGFLNDLVAGAAPLVGGMLGGPAGAAIGGALGGALGNKSAAEAAANQTPQFNPIVQGGVKRTLADVEGAAPARSFAGARVADLTSPQRQGIDLAAALATQLQGTQGDVRQAFGSFIDPGQIGANPYLDSAVAATRENAFRDLNQTQLPAIRNTAVAQGGIGGSRQALAEGTAIGRMNADLNALEMATRMGQYNTDADRVLNALQSQGQVLSGQGQPIDLLMAAGGTLQGQDQRNLDARRQQFEESRDLQYGRDTELLRMLLGAPASTPEIPATVNPIAAGLGTGIAASQLFRPPPPVQPTAQQLSGPF